MVKTFIKEIVADHVGYEEAEEVTSELSFTDDLKLDEDAVMNIISSIEDEFGIEIPEEDIETFEFIHDLESYVEQAV